MRKKSPISSKKIKEWSVILQDDSDFDYSFILSILKYKLERTRKCLLKGFASDSKKVAQEIKKVELLLKKVIDDKYEAIELKKLEEKYGPLRLKMKCDKKTGATIFTSAWDKLQPPKIKQARKGLARSYKLAFKNKQKDLQTAFDLMAKNIWKWWT